MLPFRRRPAIVAALGLTQILAWGSSYYLLAVLAGPIAQDTGWPLAWVVGGLSLGLLVEGLVSPLVGHAIERRGGRPVLAASAALLAAGLAGLAVAPGLPVYVAAWLVLGLGMGAGLYDAAFSTLGRLYGLEARRAITALTLFGGFASTVCWPLSAFLVAELGWRGACLVYAGLHAGLVLPIYLLALPREERRSGTSGAAAAGGVGPGRSRLVFVLLALSFTLSAAIAAVVSVHLLTILQARDIALAAAVALGALVGPAQVGARVLEMALGRRHHPLWTLLASTVLMAAGIGLLWAGLPVPAAALILYGGGMGIRSIARGTVPLVLFGAPGYAALMGRLALPSLIAGAAAPSLGALLLERIGAGGTLAVLFVAAAINVALAAALFACTRTLRGAAPAAPAG